MADYQSPLPKWAFHDNFTAHEAAMLICGVDPTDEDWGDGLYRDDITHREVSIVTSAIKRAIESGKLKARIEHPIEWVENSAWGITEEVLATTFRYTQYVLTGDHRPPEEDRYCIIVLKEPDWARTKVDREDLREWLGSRGIADGFFFSEAERKGEPEYLNPKHPHYAPKLAALVKAWEYVGANPDYAPGKTTKQKIEKWLNENAATYGLTDDDGMPRKSQIGELSAIANWDTRGGAPTTPNGTTP